MNAQETTVIFC